MDLFSSRAVAVTGELKKLAQDYAAKHGKPPSRRTLWLLHQQAGQNTRRTKREARTCWSPSRCPGRPCTSA